ncbi:MAG: hypothetical protein V8S54_03420 [Lachnospiraceae bacterium]
MRELMMELSSGKGTDDKWVLENVNEVWTAFYIYYYEGQYLGVYISLEGILSRIVGLEDVDGFENMLLVSETGEKLTGNEDKQRTIEKNMYGKTYLQLEERTSDITSNDDCLNFASACTGKLDDVVDHSFGISNF